jgi:hypothetical protein
VTALFLALFLAPSYDPRRIFIAFRADRNLAPVNLSTGIGGQFALRWQRE